MRRVQVQSPALRRVAVLWCAMAALLAGCGTVRYSDRPVAPVSGQPVPASAIPRLTALADLALKTNGGDAPVWATAVVTTREKALTSATPGDYVSIGEKTVVYLVTMKGHFVDGQYISLVINARTFEGMDGGLATKPPPVAPASLGPVTYLKVTTHRRPGPLPSPRCPPGASCPAPLPPPVRFATTINGRTASRPLAGPAPSFGVRPGEHLQMQVALTVPSRARVTALWVGICHDSWGWGPGDRPSGMDPILTYSRYPLPAGVHTFGMRWRVPKAQPGTSLYLCAAWPSQQPPSGSAGAIAALAVR
jgi:hypothetical protein